MNDYKLDRTAFKIQTFKEADMQYEFWKKQSIDERFRAAFYLNSIAYNFDLNNPPRMDRTAFSMRKLAN